MRSGSPAHANASALAPPPANTDRITASSTGGSRSVACWIMRRSCQFFAFGSQLLHQARRALSLCPQQHLRGVHGRGLESYRCRTGLRGILVYSRESQESLQAAAPDPRGPGKGVLRGHSGDLGGVGRIVLRGGDARNSPVESRPRAPDSALQVLRLPDGVVAGARASATRCPAHPATGSAPHRAGGSTYVRSVTLQRRTWRGAVGIALPPYMRD